MIRIIRLQNLLIAILTAYLSHWIIKIFIVTFGDQPELSGWNMILFLLALGMLMAGGFIINNILDIETDSVNSPQRVIVMQNLGNKTLQNIYIWLLILGTLLSIYVSFRLGRPYLAVIYPAFYWLLYLYSRYLKGIPLLGNLVVAFMCAMVPFLLLMAEWPVISSIKENAAEAYIYLIKLLTGMTLFAFMITISREIIKDMEDVEGDEAAGYKTLPVLYGLAMSQMVVGVLLLLLLLLIALWTYFMFLYLSTWNILLALLPLTIIAFIVTLKVLNAKGKEDYFICSQLMKIMMLVGMLHFYFLTIQF